MYYKGHRIRAGDQNLIYHFVLGWLIILFLGWLSIFYLDELLSLDFTKLSLLRIERSWSIWDLIFILASMALSGSMILLYIHFFPIIGGACGIDKSWRE